MQKHGALHFANFRACAGLLSIPILRNNAMILIRMLQSSFDALYRDVLLYRLSRESSARHFGRLQLFSLLCVCVCVFLFYFHSYHIHHYSFVDYFNFQTFPLYSVSSRPSWKREADFIWCRKAFCPHSRDVTRYFHFFF